MNFEVSDFFLNIELRNPKANQFQPVQKSRQQALIAYFSYMYYVFFHVLNKTLASAYYIPKCNENLKT